MVDTAGATITTPGVTPGGTQEQDSGSSGGDEGRRGARQWGLAPPKSALDGLRALHKAGRGGSGGGRTRRPDASGSGRIDLRNTWQIVVGSILVPIGVVFILMAWYGAAHTAYVQQQIPYLVSGSFAGLGCIVLGGLLYWAHWLYRIYDQADLHHEEQLKVFEQALRVMADRVGLADTDPGRGSLVAPSGSSGSASASAGGPGPLATSWGGRTGEAASYVVTSSGSVYHSPSCPVIAHHTEGLRLLGPGGVVDMEPCRICLAPGP